MAETSPNAVRPEAAVSVGANREAFRNIIVKDGSQRDKLTEARDLGQDLQRYKEEGVTEKGRLEALKRSKEKSFDGKNAIELRLLFGAGMAKDENGKLIPPPDGEVLAKASYEEATAAVQRVQKVLPYLNVLREAQALNLNPKTYATNKGYNYYALRDNALDTLSGASSFDEVFENLRGASLETKKAFLEATLIADPELRTQIAQNMSAVLDRARALPGVEKSQDLKQAEEDRDRLKSEIDQGVDGLIEEFRELNWEIDEQVTGRLRKMVAEGKSPDTIRRQLKQEFNVFIQKDQDRAPYLTQLNNLANKKNEVARLHADMTSLPKGKVQEGAAAKYAEALEELNQFELTLRSDNNFVNFRDFYIGITQHFEGTAQQRTFIGEELQGLSQKGRDLVGKEKDVARLKTKEEEGFKKKLADRLRQESDLIDDINLVLDNSLIDTVLKKVEEAEVLQGKRLAEISEKEQEGGVNKVIKEMKTQWIEYDPITRKKIVHKTNIGHDFKYVAYNGEEGLKRLMLRDLGITSWRTIDLSGNSPENSLSADEKKLFDNAYGKLKDEYKQKLFTDYFTARTFRDRTFGIRFGKNFLGDKEWTTGQLGLKSYEWQLLEQNFSGTIEESLQKSSEGRGALQTLKEKGIVPNFKQKWLIWLLISLGVLAAGSAFGAPALGAIPFIGRAALRG